MSTTSAYGWNIPDNTDLVKDGALAIRTLGNAIDTSMNTALGTKKAGMVLLNTTSFSAVSSQALNSVFSSTYTNYRLVLQLTASAASNLTMRIRSGTTDDTGSNYLDQYLYATSTSVSSSRATGQTSWAFSGFGIGSAAFIIADITNPFVASPTGMTTVINQNYPAVNIEILNRIYGHNQSTSYNGLNILISAGTITGTASVYGYNI